MRTVDFTSGLDAGIQALRAVLHTPIVKRTLPMEWEVSTIRRGVPSVSATRMDLSDGSVSPIGCFSLASKRRIILGIIEVVGDHDTARGTPNALLQVLLQFLQASATNTESWIPAYFTACDLVIAEANQQAVREAGVHMRVFAKVALCDLHDGIASFGGVGAVSAGWHDPGRGLGVATLHADVSIDVNRVRGDHRAVHADAPLGALSGRPVPALLERRLTPGSGVVLSSFRAPRDVPVGRGVALEHAAMDLVRSHRPPFDECVAMAAKRQGELP